MRRLLALFPLLLGGVSAAPLLKQVQALPACQLPGKPNQPVPVPLYNEADRWVDLWGRLQRIEFKRTNTLDAYGRLTLYYSSGQLRRVEESRDGITGSSGTHWDISAGKVVKAERYFTDGTAKRIATRLPLQSMPQLYLEKPGPEWFKKVACRPF